VTFDENSHQLNYILSDGFEINNDILMFGREDPLPLQPFQGLLPFFEIVFSLCFRFGNNWLVLNSSSSNWQFGICLQNYALVLAIISLVFLSAEQLTGAGMASVLSTNHRRASS
jgi:hypothetical protein